LGNGSHPRLDFALPQPEPQRVDRARERKVNRPSPEYSDHEIADRYGRVAGLFQAVDYSLCRYPIPLHVLPSSPAPLVDNNWMVMLRAKRHAGFVLSAIDGQSTDGKCSDLQDLTRTSLAVVRFLGVLAVRARLKATANALRSAACWRK